MEEDPSFKQLIPYVLFRWTDADGTVHLFEYLRGSGQGERRLHAKRSVGVGGHISTIDADGRPSRTTSTAKACAASWTKKWSIDTPYTRNDRRPDQRR